MYFKRTTLVCLNLVSLLLLIAPHHATKVADIAIAGYRRHYEDDHPPSLSAHTFGRFQSPQVIMNMCNQRSHSFKKFHGKDGRRGYVRSTKLEGDWVLAESKQTAVACTCEEVLRTYLTGSLQTEWNQDKVIDCKISPQTGTNGEAYYQQDLVLHSQRVIRCHTGVMKYSQRIRIDRVGDDYCVSVQLDPRNATERKPFEELKVYVNLQQRGNNVEIYAAGVMKVNRKVVPNLVVFDASAIAGSMAGKGTLWLAGYFDKRRDSLQSKKVAAK